MGTVLLLLIAIGAILRMTMPFLGHNYDAESFTIVAKLVSQGKNIYANTTRYSYSPLYGYVFGLSYAATSLAVPTGTDNVFRFVMPIFLTLADIGITLFLFKRFGLLPAALFILNPISIIISGYHNQIDNVAILLGLLAADYFDKSKNLGRNSWLSLILLGLSLSVKQTLIAFPLWLAAKRKKWSERIIVLAVPFVILILFFLPSVPGGSPGIVENVIKYRSSNNAPFFFSVLPRFINTHISSYVIFYFSLLAGAIIFRQKLALTSLLYYLLALVIFSPSVTPQYLVIPVISLSVFPNPFYLLYTLLGTLDFTVFNIDELHLRGLARFVPQMISNEITTYRGATDWMIVFLFLGFLWMFFGNKWMRRIVMLFRPANDNRRKHQSE